MNSKRERRINIAEQNNGQHEVGNTARFETHTKRKPTNKKPFRPIRSLNSRWRELAQQIREVGGVTQFDARDNGPNERRVHAHAQPHGKTEQLHECCGLSDVGSDGRNAPARGHNA